MRWSRSVPVALLLGVALVLGAPVTLAEDLGRLFTTSGERRTLDQLRLEAQFARPEPTPELAPQRASTPEPSGPTVSRLEINGIVRRSRGPATVWINGALVERGQVSREGLRVQSGARPSDGVRVRLPSGLSTVRLKPGQAVDVSTGTLVDAFEQRPDPDGPSGLQAPSPMPGSVPGAPDVSGAVTDPVSGAAGAVALPPVQPAPAAVTRRELTHQQLREISALPSAKRADALKALQTGARTSVPAAQ